MTKATATLLAVSVVAFTAVIAAANDSRPPETTIWFNAPANDFTESSPMGNGRLGAMMFGGVENERIVLNESSVWSGSRQDADRPEASKNAEAEALVNAEFLCQGPGSSGRQYGCYQVLGNLHLRFSPDETNAPATDYHRELNLNDAMTRVTFNRGGVEFTREMFVSAPDETMVLRLNSNQRGRISFDASLDRPERFQTIADGHDGLLMTGQLDNGADGKGVRYAARVRVLNRGGKVSLNGNVLSVHGADEA